MTEKNMEFNKERGNSEKDQNLSTGDNKRFFKKTNKRNNKMVSLDSKTFTGETLDILANQ